MINGLIKDCVKVNQFLFIQESKTYSHVYIMFTFLTFNVKLDYRFIAISLTWILHGMLWMFVS